MSSATLRDPRIGRLFAINTLRLAVVITPALDDNRHDEGLGAVFAGSCDYPPRLRTSGALNLDGDQSSDLHDEIVRIEERIERLTEKIESCRKLILASRIAVTGGAFALIGMLFGAIGFDPAVMAAAVAALLGGIAVWGSNRSTAQEAMKELTSREADRSMLIQKMNLRDVTPLRELSTGPQDDTIV